MTNPNGKKPLVLKPQKTEQVRSILCLTFVVLFMELTGNLVSLDEVALSWPIIPLIQ